MSSISRLTYALLPLSGLALWSYVCIHIVPLGSCLDTILWTFRSWRHGYPVSQDLRDWKGPGNDDEDEYMRRTFRAMDAWRFLSPFFASRGYTLYVRSRAAVLLPPARPLPSSSQEYPFARLLGTPEEYDFGVMCIWAARDNLGRDVIIKLISDSKPSPEVEALRRFNTPSARLDPRNRTIPVLDFVEWGTLLFVIMPRWSCAFFPDFQYVAEAVHLWEQLLEGLEFCHEHRVAHCDILEQNTVVDFVTDRETMNGVKDAVGPESLYAFIDFGHASVLPYSMSIEDAPLRDDLIFEMRSNLGDRRPCNPFVADVMFLGAIVQRFIRMAPDVFPEGIQLVNKMMGLNGHRVPTASEALNELRAIKSHLGEDDLKFYLPGRMWRQYEGGEPFIAKRFG